MRTEVAGLAGDVAGTRAFYFLTGTGRMRLGKQSWQTKSGSFVEVPANVEHNLINTGEDDWFLAIFFWPAMTRRTLHATSDQTP